MPHKQPVDRRIVAAAVLLAGLLSAAPALGQEIQPVKAPAPGVPPPAGGGAADEGPRNLFDLLYRGGPVMIPIGICSVLALAFAIERFLSLKREKVIPAAFIEGLRQVFRGPEDVERGVAHCEADPSPLSNVFLAGLKRLREGSEGMEKAVEDAGGREAHKMARSLKPLSVIATVAPLMGLLGTVYGMISAFQSATAQTVNKADTLSRGIYEALVTTAAGLTLAIPVLIVYELLSSRVDTLVDRMDDEAIEFLEYSACGRQKAAAPAGEAPADVPAVAAADVPAN